VFCPPSIRAGGGTNADEVLAKQFFGVRKCGTLSQDLLRWYSIQKVYSFCKKRICQNFGSFVFEFGCRKWKRRVRSVASQGRSTGARRGSGIFQQENIRDQMQMRLTHPPVRAQAPLAEEERSASGAP